MWCLDGFTTEKLGIFSVLDAWMLGCVGFIYTLEIVAHYLSYGVNRDRLCGTNVLSRVASARFLGKSGFDAWMLGCGEVGGWC